MKADTYRHNGDLIRHLDSNMNVIITGNIKAGIELKLEDDGDVCVKGDLEQSAQILIINGNIYIEGSVAPNCQILINGNGNITIKKDLAPDCELTIIGNGKITTNQDNANINYDMALSLLLISNIGMQNLNYRNSIYRTIGTIGFSILGAHVFERIKYKWLSEEMINNINYASSSVNCLIGGIGLNYFGVPRCVNFIRNFITASNDEVNLTRSQHI